MILDNDKEIRWLETAKAWIILSRPPFHAVGVLPFLLGAMLSWRINGLFNWSVFAWGAVAVIMIMLSTYYAGEYYDLEVDRLSAGMQRNAFSGGTQVILKGSVPKEQARYASYITLALAGIIGVLLQFYYNTGAWTIPLGIIGMAAGFLYSTEPVRWVKRGIGEILIGFCYGWLPVAVSYYLQCGGIDHLVNWISIPIACSIFNVILINEFPDYPADVIAGKANLVVRFGKDRAAFLYAALVVVELIAFPVSVMKGISYKTYLFYPFVFLMSSYAAYQLLRGGYRDREKLEVLCALTICVNFIISISYILSLWFWGI